MNVEFKLLADNGFDAKAVIVTGRGVNIKYFDETSAVNLSAKQVETLYHKLFVEGKPCEPKPPFFVRTL